MSICIWIGGLARGEIVAQLGFGSRRCPDPEMGGKVGETRWDDAWAAVRAGDLDRLDAMLQEDPELTYARGDNGCTLLHAAAECDRRDVASELLKRGADLEAEAPWGQTPLEWAANLGSTEVARVLLEAGAARLHIWTMAALGMREVLAAALDQRRAGRVPREGADLSGWPEGTAFRRGDALSDACYIASRNGHASVVADLLARGADPEALGYFGAPALHWAASGGHTEVVERLLGAGADPTRRDPRFDADAAGWAREGGHEELAERLESHRP
jgi:ankyrin repeat protein